MKTVQAKVQVIPVTDGVWCFRRPSYFACSYLVASGSGAIAMDVGMDSDAADFLGGMRALGIPAEHLRAVLLTHWHNNHSAGAAFLKREFGARIYYAAGDRLRLMARPVTPDLPLARTSALRCLRENVNYVPATPPR